MSRQVKISINLNSVNKSVDRRTAIRCLTHCPKLLDRNSAGVTFRQIRFCPIKAERLTPMTCPCAYGRRIIQSAYVQASRKRRGNVPTSSPKK